MRSKGHLSRVQKASGGRRASRETTSKREAEGPKRPRPASGSPPLTTVVGLRAHRLPEEQLESWVRRACGPCEEMGDGGGAVFTPCFMLQRGIPYIWKTSIASFLYATRRYPCSISMDSPCQGLQYEPSHKLVSPHREEKYMVQKWLIMTSYDVISVILEFLKSQKSRIRTIFEVFRI